MIKNFKNIIKIASLILFGSIFLYNCESDADNLGEQLFVGNAAQENIDSYDVIAYNVNNNDSIRSDDAKLVYAQLGAFSEGVFGMQKAEYASQIRLNSYAPTFGTNPIVDSVVLVMNLPINTYSSDSLTTTTTDYIYPEGSVASSKVVNSYPIIKYGKTKIGGKTVLNIKVHEVTDFLKTGTDLFYSNENVNYSTLLGSKAFDGNINSVSITKKSDNAVLFSTNPSLRIPLSATYFQNKIIAKEGSNDLKDAYNFIRYFRGLRISVDENDGYLFPFSPSNVSVVMYYKNDVTTSGVVTRTQNVVTLPMGDAPNSHLGKYTYNRTGTTVADALATTNTTTGDKKLYIQGMGGPSIVFKIPPTTIEQLKTKLKNEKIGIISAKVRIYTDKVVWNNSYTKPSSFVFLEKDATAFLAETSTLTGAPGYALVKPYDLDQKQAYYDFTITKTLKDVVEKEATNKDYIVQMGTFLTNETGSLVTYNYTSRSYSPTRLVFVGTDPNSDQRIQLKVIYGSKNN
jgi:hypothetical protein